MGKVIGLTGGIGSGKTAVGHILETLGVKVIDADIIARQIVEPNMPALKAIQKLFGDQVIDKSGQLNRAKLREMIFNDNSKKQQLEQLLHPLIQAEIQQQIEQNQTHYNLIAVAMPLLIEAILKGNKPSYISQVWVVDCPVEQQIERASARDNNSKAQIEKIIAAQASREQRLEHANKVIDNSGSLDALQIQVKKMVAELS